MKGILFLLLILILSSCVDIRYKDPTTSAQFSYTSWFKKTEGVEVVYASPTKVVAISVAKTENDPILEQIGDIIEAYK
jgi:hypothetical protein